ncbi:MAG: hypothetical protein R3F04_13245 [Lysobacteraceae bacterium]
MTRLTFGRHIDFKSIGLAVLDSQLADGIDRVLLTHLAHAQFLPHPAVLMATACTRALTAFAVAASPAVRTAMFSTARCAERVSP